MQCHRGPPDVQLKGQQHVPHRRGEGPDEPADPEHPRQSAYHASMGHRQVPRRQVISGEWWNSWSDALHLPNRHRCCIHTGLTNNNLLFTPDFFHTVHD